MDGRMILKSLLKTKEVWERVRINSIRTGPAASCRASWNQIHFPRKARNN